MANAGSRPKTCGQFGLHAARIGKTPLREPVAATHYRPYGLPHFREETVISLRPLPHATAPSSYRLLICSLTAWRRRLTRADNYHR